MRAIVLYSTVILGKNYKKGQSLELNNEALIKELLTLKCIAKDETLEQAKEAKDVKSKHAKA